MDACVIMAGSFPFPPETITTLLIGHSPIQNKKFFKKESLEVSWRLVTTNAYSQFSHFPVCKPKFKEQIPNLQ